MAVEYITSRNMVDLIYETLRLMNKPLAHHCMRVSFIMSKMLETKGGYEKYEIADFMVLAMLHDVGAYKTDDVRKQLTFDAKTPLPHSVYGYLFVKYLSPLDEQSKMILYHHMDYSKTKELDYKYSFETEVLKVAEIMDVWHRSLGDQFDYKVINRYSGSKFDPKVCDLLFETVDKFDIFTKLTERTYKQDFSNSLEYVLLSDDEKDKYLKMLMYCTGLKEEQMVSETVATMYVCRELARKLKLSEMDKNEVYYAALLHDIGMLAIPKELLGAPRNLNNEEKNLIKTHVDIMEKTLENRLSKEIIKVAASHHERFDASGYPRGLKGSAMGTKEAILQISEQVVNAMEPKPYREAHTRQEILDDLNNGIIAGKYDGIVADTFVRNYDEIMDKAAARAAAALVTHQKLMRNYNQVYRSLV